MRDSTMGLALVLICFVVALLNVAAHWFPWRVVPGAADETGRLRRMLAYGYGVLTILAGMVGWALACALVGRAMVSPWEAVGVLALVVLAAGAGTAAAYAIDAMAEARALAADIAEYEARIPEM